MTHFQHDEDSVNILDFSQLIQLVIMSVRHCVCSTEDVHDPSVWIETVNHRNGEYEVLRGVMLQGGIEAQRLNNWGVYTKVKRYKYPFILLELNKNLSLSNCNSLCPFLLSPPALYLLYGRTHPLHLRHQQNIR